MTASATTGEVAQALAVSPTARRSGLGAHIPVLDGLRGLAILLVLLQHFAHFDSLADAPGGAITHAVLKVFSLGWVGVDLFFVLSGFLITGILVDAKGTPGFFRNFYMRRVLRIFPLYYLTLAFLFGVLPFVLPPTMAFSITQANQLWLWLYGTNLLESGVLIPGGPQGFKLVNEYFNTTHFWSLAVEEHFYMIWPALVFVLSRRGVIQTCVVTIIGALVLRLVMAANGYHEDAVHQFTLCRFDALTLGGMLAVLARQTDGIARLMRPMFWVAIVTALLAVPVGLKWGLATGPVAWTVLAGKYTVLAGLFGALLVLCVGAAKGSTLNRVFSNPVLRFFGKYSYGIYVLHWLCEPWWMANPYFSRATLMRSLGATGGLAVYMVIAVAASVLMALLSWHLCEKHFLKLKRFFEYRAVTA